MYRDHGQFAHHCGQCLLQSWSVKAFTNENLARYGHCARKNAGLALASMIRHFAISRLFGIVRNGKNLR